MAFPRPAPVSHSSRSEPAQAACCPLCEQPIPQELSDAVQSRILAREREREAEIARDRQAATAAAEARIKDEIEAARARHVAELAAVREETKRAAESALADKLQEAEAGRRALEEQFKALKAEQAAREKAQLEAQKDQLEREKTLAVQAAEAKAFDEKQKMMGKMADLQRQLENKTAQDLGYGPEVDLFELLKTEFPEDRIARVEKGAAGADVVHDIYHNGRHCGRIVYDSKNSSAWRNDYVTKLRADQQVAKADHAVLSTRSFPSGVKELHAMDGVVVVSPHRVHIIAQLLRRHVIQTAGLRLSNEARQQKTAALYAFIMSEQCGNLLSSISSVADEMHDLDRREEKAHQQLWKKRAEYIKSIQRAHGDLTFEIERIIGTAGNMAASDGES